MAIQLESINFSYNSGAAVLRPLVSPYNSYAI